MQQLSYFELVGFGPNGWGFALVRATGMTLAVAFCGALVGALVGSLVAWAKIAGGIAARGLADGYTTILRGIPDLLVIYLFYFGSGAAVRAVASRLGYEGYIDPPPFLIGALAIGVVSGAYQAEVYRGAYQTVARGEIEAAKSVGMHRFLMFRRIIAPQVLRHAIPGLGNVWQLVLKESALISVTGLVELLRQTNVAAGSTRRPFDFFLTGALLYLLVTWASTLLFQQAENRALRGVRKAA